MSSIKRPTPSWLASAIFYEIYPQSFLDTNGDGIGDLPGIIAKLDYIQSIGCNALWLNPCFESPFGDAGYDVSDFCKVAPRYGTNADLKRLFKAAHKRGMKVCLDLVAGHTSNEHPWFKESCKPQKNKYSNWYIWSSTVWDQGGPKMRMINGYSQRDGNYAPNFFWFQPALNYGFANLDPERPWQLPVDHPDVKAVRAEMIRIMRFWLDMGCDGFRVDMAPSLVKNDPDLVETGRFWKEVRDMYNRDYPECVLISEWSFPKQSIPSGFHIDFMIHFGTPAYTALFRRERYRDAQPYTAVPDLHGSFFDKAGKGNICDFLPTYLEHYKATRDLGYISLPSGNHDICRLGLGRSKKDLEVAFAFLLTMPGVPYFYAGDEIGMTHVEGLPSKEGGYGRTGSRTPMQWNGKKNAGFSSAAAGKLYLPLDPRRDRPTVEEQEQDRKSLLNHIRALVELRQQTPALGANGDFEVLYAEPWKYPFVYHRKAKESASYIIAVNPSNKKAECAFAVGKKGALRLVMSNAKPDTQISNGKCTLCMQGVSYAVYAWE